MRTMLLMSPSSSYCYVLEKIVCRKLNKFVWKFQLLDLQTTLVSFLSVSAESPVTNSLVFHFRNLVVGN
jgi:hypothetical protein